MIIQLYGLCFIASMVFLILLAVVGQRQNITNFLLLFVAIMIINLGYLTISIAPSLIVAIRGNNLVYLGSVFTPMLLFLSVVRLCRRRANHGLSFFLLLFAAVILYFSFQLETSTDFYRKLSIVEKGGASFLEKEYGPMHALFPIYLALCMALSAGTILRSWRRREDVSWKVMLGLLAAALQSVGCYVGKRIFHSDIEWIALGYLLDELLILFLIRRIGMYEVSDNIARVLEEHSACGYMIFDKKKNYLGCNDKAKEYLPEIGSLRIDYTVTRDAAFLYENVAEKLEAFDEDKPNEPYYISHNEKELRCSVRPLHHGKGKRKVGFIMSIEDDTQRQRYISLLHDHNAELEEARRKADEANHAKSDFLSNMSHEIRTPMNTIVGMTEILLREPLPPQAREYLMNIKNSGSALLSIINDILDFSKIESGKLDIIEEEYEPMSMLSDLAMIFLNRIGEKEVELLFDIDADLPARLYGDALRIRQVIINIANNAIKFTETGYVCLTIQAGKREGDYMELLVSVKDTGQGIKAEDMDRLFGSFSQVDTKKNRHKEGTGLGLSISKRLVEMMGGQIHVSSEYGRGSEFYFVLPQKIVNPQRAAQIRGNAQKSVSGSMKTECSMEMLRKLAAAYGLDFVEREALSEKNISLIEIDFFFTDSLELLTPWEKEMLQNNKTVVCLLQNPMTETMTESMIKSRLESSVTVLNKPLYSLNFCQAVNRDLQGPATEEENVLNFTAPDASVLLVDDNEMNLKVALGLLKPLGMQIDTAENGKRALEMIGKKRYDLIFMDHMMPVMDGIEAVKKLRQMEEAYYKEVPVVALTANAIVDAKKEFLKAGMNDFISKPIKMKEMCAKIKKYLPREYIKEAKESEERPEDLYQGVNSSGREGIGASKFETEALGTKASGTAISGLAMSETETFGTVTSSLEVSEINRLESEGLDVAEGIRNSGSQELFISLLGDFYKLIDIKATKIEKCLADGMIRDYTIEVHALKNTARMIGVMELSELFYRMEQYGNEGNLDALARETPRVLEAYRKYKPVLKPYGGLQAAGKKQAPKEEMAAALRELETAIENFDLDYADEAMKRLEEYRFPEDCQQAVEELRAYVADVAMEDILEITAKLIQQLGTNGEEDHAEHIINQ